MSSFDLEPPPEQYPEYMAIENQANTAENMALVKSVIADSVLGVQNALAKVLSNGALFHNLEVLCWVLGSEAGLSL